MKNSKTHTLRNTRQGYKTSSIIQSRTHKSHRIQPIITQQTQTERSGLTTLTLQELLRDGKSSVARLEPDRTRHADGTELSGGGKHSHASTVTSIIRGMNVTPTGRREREHLTAT